MNLEADAYSDLMHALIARYPMEFTNRLVPRLLEEPGGREALCEVLNDFRMWASAEAHRLKAMGALDFEETSAGRVMQ